MYKGVHFLIQRKSVIYDLNHNSSYAETSQIQIQKALQILRKKKRDKSEV